MSKEVNEKLKEYISLMDFKDNYYGKDYKNNVKFIKWAILKMIKNNIEESEIIDFIKTTINIHKEIYCC